MCSESLWNLYSLIVCNTVNYQNSVKIGKYFIIECQYVMFKSILFYLSSKTYCELNPFRKKLFQIWHSAATLPSSLSTAIPQKQKTSQDQKWGEKANNPPLHNTETFSFVLELVFHS